MLESVDHCRDGLRRPLWSITLATRSWRCGGAPVAQPDQARRACQAALEMQVALGPLNARLAKTSCRPKFKVAIGIHTGTAQVGNIGSRRKNSNTARSDTTVNLAQFACKERTSTCGPSLLITKDTHDALG